MRCDGFSTVGFTLPGVFLDRNAINNLTLNLMHNHMAKRVYAKLFAGTPIIQQGYLALRDFALYKESSLVGPITNKFLVGFGIAKSFKYLQACHPLWVNLSLDDLGIRCDYNASDIDRVSVSIDWLKALASVESHPESVAWDVDSTSLFMCDPLSVDLMQASGDLSWDSFIVNMFRSIMRQIFAGPGRDSSFVVDPRGEVSAHPPIDNIKFLSDCVGRVLRYQSGRQVCWLVQQFGARRLITNSFDGRFSDPAFEVFRCLFSTKFCCSERPIRSDDDGGLWLAIAPGMSRSDLLKLCGDVESNPGPSWKFIILMVVLATAYHYHEPHDAFSRNLISARIRISKTVSSFWYRYLDLDPVKSFVSLVRRVPDPFLHAFDHFVMVPIRNHAYECAVVDREREFWRHEYDTNLFFLRVMRAFSQWPIIHRYLNIPTRPELDEVDYSCKVAYHFVGKPLVMDMRPFNLYESLVYSFKVFVVVLTITSGFSGFLLVYLFTRRFKVRVINHNRPVEFDTDCVDLVRELNLRTLNQPQIDDCIDDLCISTLTGESKNVQVVAERWDVYKPYQDSIHLCQRPSALSGVCDTVSAFQCAHRACDCSDKEAMPFTYISGCDFQFNQDELCKIVTGPTLIKTYNDDISYPCGGGPKLTVQDNIRTLRFQNGLVLVGPRHPWALSGIVVGLDSAFEYKVIWSKFGISLILAIPSSGLYDRHSPVCMVKPDQSSYPNIDGFVVQRTDVSFDFSHCYEKSESFSVPRSHVESCAVTLAGMNRDDKYASTAMAYVTGQCRAAEIDLTHLSTIVRFVCHLADVHALSIVPDCTSFFGRPSELTLIGRLRCLVWLRFCTHLPDRIQSIFVKLVMSRPVVRSVAWAFPTIYVPCYEIHTSISRTRRLFSKPSRFVADRFPSSPSPADARFNNKDHSCTGENTRECDSIIGNAGIESRGQAPPVFEQQSRIGSSIRNDGGLTKPSPSPRRECPKPKPRATQHPNAESRKGSVSSGSSESYCSSDVYFEARGSASQSSDARPDQPDELRQESGGPASDAIPSYFGTSSWTHSDGDKLLFQTLFCDQTNSNLVLEGDFKCLFDNTTEDEAQRAAEWIDNIRNRIRAYDPRFGSSSQIRKLCRIAITGEIPPSGGVFSFDGGDLFLEYLGGDHRHGPPTFTIGAVDATISLHTSKTTSGSERASEDVGLEYQGSSNKKFFKNRNKRQRDRSSKHQSP
jgi:hypothetical protein